MANAVMSLIGVFIDCFFSYLGLCGSWHEPVTLAPCHELSVKDLTSQRGA
jgi:hypothetical protein